MSKSNNTSELPAESAISMYIYQKSQPGTWTVGYFTASGEWKPECDCNSAADAAQRAHWLNGGNNTENTEPYNPH